MTKEQAIAEAKKEANKNNVTIVVVNDPIANAEDETGPYGYCPIFAKDMLFRFGTVEEIIKPARTTQVV